MQTATGHFIPSMSFLLKMHQLVYNKTEFLLAWAKLLRRVINERKSTKTTTLSYLLFLEDGVVLFQGQLLQDAGQLI